MKKKLGEIQLLEDDTALLSFRGCQMTEALTEEESQALPAIAKVARLKKDESDKIK